MKEYRFISNNEDATIIAAQKLACLFRAGDIIILDGDLGAGKTCFVKGFTEGCQSLDRVTSPTFSIAHLYKSNIVDILHIDLYRIATVDEFNDLGLIDYFDQSIVLIEWGEKFSACFEAYITISFEITGDNTRTITFTSNVDKYDSLINILNTDFLC